MPDKFTISINNGVKTVEAFGNSTLLVALARSNIFVPSACGGKGRCGLCKVVVPNCKQPYTQSENSLLSIDDRAQGKRLACQIKIDSDLSIEVPVELFTAKRFSGRLIEKKMLTRDVAHLRIELVVPDSIDFIAGQYLQLRTQPYEDHEAVVRAFSIASPPSDKNHVELIIRRVPGGVCTGWIFDKCQPGQQMFLTGPFGSFYMSSTNAPAVFIAGSTGMAPMRSMLLDMKEKKPARTVRFFFGVVTRQDLFMADEMAAISKELPGFTFIPALSGEPQDSPWAGDRGLITEVVARHVPNASGHEAYVCGSPGMIEASVKILAGLGMGLDKIYYDKF